MTATFDEISFLARSPNRIAVLRALCEGPATRGDLRNTVDVSSPTIGRILPALEQRDWIHRDGHHYEITPLGRLVTKSFTDLHETIAITQQLRPIVRWLPTGQLEFDLQRLSDATVTLSTGSEPAAPTQRAHELICGADRLRTVSPTFNDRGLESVWEAVVQGELSFEGIFTRGAIQRLVAQPERETMVCQFLASDAVLYAANSEIPFSVTIVDDRVYFLARDEDGLLRALVETDDDSVRAWAVSVYETHREDASQIKRDELPDTAR